MTNASKVIDTLNALIETCKDGEYGFRECAEHATAAPLKSMFNDRALECQAAAAELQRAVAQAGAEPGTGGSVKGALHRGWLSLRSAFPGDDNVAMLDEAERGEDRALESYRQALAEDLPPNVRLLVQRQLIGVQRNHDRVRELKEQYRAVA
ncbi:PA2169 family four-helix-bundle protein [Methyloversatilis thermotolerans]|uniref:PA2169 family four-helix-bundle protein n=1 Tax=Methyloversatilis thermotolerans TaxID=1346290 RepID=UPI00036907E4|nr:PA2169 family four-helix-bundle protein [Methyloversatilis thermotolerans]